MVHKQRKSVFDVQRWFPQARYTVAHTFDNGSQLHKASGMGRDTCYDLMNADVEDYRFSPAVQQKVMDLCEGSILGDQLRRRIKAGDDEYARLADYKGRYLYYRYNLQGTPVSGAMIIEQQQKVWVAKHYNDPFDDPRFDEEHPDHEGFAYIAGDRLNIVGLGQRYFRPIIANVVKSVQRDYVVGIVIAVQQGGGLFGASFVMVHETHKDFVKPETEHYYKLIGKTNGLAGILVPGTA